MGLQGFTGGSKELQVFQSLEHVHSLNCYFLALSMMSLKVLIFTKWKKVGAFCKISPSCQKRIDRRARLLLCVHLLKDSFSIDSLSLLHCCAQECSFYL